MVEWVRLTRSVDVAPVEHVGSTIAIVQFSTETHHVGPTFSNASTAELIESKEENEECTNNKNRCLDRRHCHHTLHTTNYGEDCRDGNKSESTPPEWQANEIFEEDTASESSNTYLRENISNQGNDGEPGACCLCIAELQEVWHSDDFAHLVVQKLIERYEEPTENQNHPSLHFPVCHTNTVLCTSTCKAYEVL